ncbi:MAG: PIN domain-containing protein [Acidimicrobiales bacterium]
MSRLLFDTTFLVDTERTGDGLDEVIEDDDDVAVAAVTIAELLVGVELAVGSRRRSRRAFMEDVLGAIPVISYDRETAESHARLLVAAKRQGRPRGAHDLLIAATAHASGRTVVTADATGFADLPEVTVRLHR